MQNKLTQWSTLQLYRRDCKNCQHLDHNISYHVCHCHSGCKDSVYLKTAEEMFDVIKNVSYLFSARARVFSRLGARSQQSAQVT
jgi:hypothetical protein